MDMTAYAQALLASVTLNTIIPLAILFTFLCISWWMLRKAQKKPDFNIENMLRDENGKESATRYIALMAFAFSSWMLAVEVLAAKLDTQRFFYYLLAWSGSLVLADLVKRWDGSLPFTKPKE